MKSERDKTLYELGLDMEAQLTGLLFKVRWEMAIAGAEYQNACAVFEEDVKSDVNRNVAEARTIQAKLDAIERKKGGSKSPASMPPKS